MKTLNVRLVLILLGCAVVFGGAMYGINRFQKRRNAHVFKELADEALARAEAAEEEGNLRLAREEKEEALKNLRWYLDLAGDDIDTYEEYALLFAEVAIETQSPTRANDALMIFEDLLRKDNTRDQCRRKEIDLAIRMRQLSLAKRRIDELLAKSPTDAELLAKSALCQVAEDKPEEAARLYREALRYAPHERDYYVGLASVLRNRLKRPDEADQCMVDLVFLNRGAYEAHYLRGEYLRTTGKLYLETEPLEWTDEDRQALNRTIDALMEQRAALAQAVETFRKSELEAGDALAEAVDAVKTTAGSADALAAAGSRLARRRAALAGPQQVVSQCRAALEKALGELKLRDEDRESLTGVIEELKASPAPPDTLTAAVEAFQANPDDREALAEVFAILQKEADMLRNATAFLVRAPDAFTSGIKVVLGSRDAYEEALEALRLKNDDADVILLAARCAAVRRDYDRARALAQRGIDLHPETVRMYHTLADVAVRRLHEELTAEREEAAKVNWAKAAEHRRNAVKYRDQALDALRQGLNVVQDDPDLLWTLTNLLIDVCRIEDSRGQENAGKTTGELDVETLREAQKTLDRLRAVEHRIIPEALIDYLQARIDFEQGHWLAAARGFEQCRPGLVGRPRLSRKADMQLSKCYGELDRVAKQEAVLERILEEDPFYPQALAALADLKMFDGRPEEALEEFNKLAVQDKLPAAGWLPLARMLLLRNLNADSSKRNWQEVLDALAKAAEVMPGSYQVVLLQAEVSRARAHEQLVRAQLLASRAENEEAPAEKQQLLQQRQQALDQAQAHFQAAEKMLLEARDKSPKTPELWSALVALALRREAWDQAKTLLEQAENLLGDTVGLRLSRAAYLMERPGTPALSELRALAENTDGFSHQEKVRLFDGLLGIAFRMGDTEHGRKLCRRVAALEPNNVRIRFLLLETAIRYGGESKVQEIINLLTEIRNVEGEGPHWLYGQAVRLNLEALASIQESANDPQKQAQYQEKLAQAQQYLARAREFRRNWSRIPALAGLIYEQQGNSRKALENYLVAIDLGEGNPEVLDRTLRLLYRAKEFERVKEVVDKFAGRMDSSERFSRFRDIQALKNWQEGKQKVALGYFRRKAAESDDHRYCLMLGRLLVEKAQTDRAHGRIAEARASFQEAEDAYRRSVTLAGTTSETWTELIRLLVATGQKPKALAAIEEARGKIPPDQLPLALAEFYAVSGETARAEAQYKKILAATPDSPVAVRAAADFFLATNKLPEAEQLLRRFADGSVKGNPGDVVWARRRLAAILSNRPDFPSRVEAIALIEQNRKETHSAIEDLRLLGSLLVGHPNRDERARGIQIFEKIVQLPSVIPEDRYILAQLYLAQKDSYHANEQFVALLTMPGGSQPRYFAASIRALLDDGNTEEAARRLSRLEDVAPHQFVTVDLRAAVAFARGEYGRARDELARYVGNSKAQPSDPAVRLYQAAFRLEQFAARLSKEGKRSEATQFVVEAETMLRKFVRDRMGQELVLASFLARQGKFDEALGLIERHWAENPPQRVASALGYVLKNSAVKPAQSRRGEAIMQAALKKFNRPLDLLLVFGDAMALQQRYAEAEKYYRECLTKNDRDARVMNNLALFLALKKENLDEALQLINGAIAIQGPTPAMLDSRATVYLAMNQPVKALDDLAAALEEEIEPSWLFRQALAYDRIGRRQSAAASLKRAIEEEGLTAEMLPPNERAVFQELQSRLL